MQSPRITLAWAFHHAVCKIGSIPATACAYSDCPKPGYPRHFAAEQMEHGVQRWFFCSTGHLNAWLHEQEQA